MRKLLPNTLGAMLAAVLTAAPLVGQTPPPQPSPAPTATGTHIAGKITAISGTSLTVQTQTGTVVRFSTPAETSTRTEHGGAFQVIIAPSTRWVAPRGRRAALKDLAIGDQVVVTGTMDAAHTTLQAIQIIPIPRPASKSVAVLSSSVSPGTLIAGRVQAIGRNHSEITIQQSRSSTQTIDIPPQSPFQQLAATIEVGDNVSARGSLRSGTFALTQLTVRHRPDPRDADLSPLNPATP